MNIYWASSQNFGLVLSKKNNIDEHILVKMLVLSQNIIFMNIYWVLSQNFGFKSKRNIYEHILGFRSKSWF